MKNPGIITVIVIVVILALIGALYYFFGPKKTSPTTKTCPDGSTIPISQSCPTTKTCPDGSVIPIAQTCPGQTLTYSVGDQVYLSGDSSLWASGAGLPVYRAPIADSQGNFLEGATRADWYPGQSIGNVQEIIPGWVKVYVGNLQIWRYIPGTGFTMTIGNLTGNYWFADNAVSKLP